MCNYKLGVKALQQDLTVGMLALELYQIGIAGGNEAYETERQRILSHYGEEKLQAVDAAFDVINLNRGKFGLEVENG